MIQPATDFASMLVPELRNFFERQRDVRIAYLHGSVVRDMFREESDLDIAVMLDDGLDARARFRRALDLAQAIDGLRLAPQEADVRVLNDAPLEFRFEVCANGLCLLERDAEERVTFETTTLIEFYDFKPALDVYYRGVLARAKSGEPSAKARRHREKIRALIERNREA